MTRRWPMLVLIPGLLVGALLFDQRADTERARRDQPSTAAEADLAHLLPVGAPPGSLSTTWYCAGGTATKGGAADHAVVIANPTGTPTAGTITAVPSVGRSVTKPVRLAAYSRVRVTLTDLVTAPYAAAQVEFRGGRVVVEHEVSGPDGIDAAACASSASASWYFASGTTTRNATETLVLFNPFPDAAAVDISFATPQGRRTPGSLQGFQVPGGSVVAAPINPAAQVDAQVSASVIARTGRVVVDRIQSFNGETATTTEEDAANEAYKPKGLTIALGVPRPTTAWLFPIGIKAPGAHERFVVFNPTRSEAEVDLQTTLVDPQVNGELDPFSLTVPAGGYQIVELDDEDRVPTRVDHSTLVVATNGVPVVVDRMLATESPFPGRGTAVSSGTPVVAPRWVFASGGNVPDRLSERIALHNPSGRRVTVSIRVLSGGKVLAVPGASRVTLAAHQHRVVRFADKLSDRQVSVLVVASSPIAAERLLYRIGDQGISTTIGIPLAGGLVEVPANATG